MPDDIQIESATVADLNAIVDLWMEMMREHEGFDPRVRLSERAEEAYRHYAQYYVDRADAAVYVARRAREVIGFCLAYRARNLPMFLPGNYGFLSDLAIRRAWRGRGIGQRLLDAVKHWFRQQGITHIQLQVYANNTRGVAFWRKQGFEDFVHGMWVDIPPGS